MGGIEWIYFEGGEPFLHYGLLLNGVKMAVEHGFKVGLVTNAFWAINPQLALTRLQPLAGLVQDMAVSTDRYHSGEDISRQAQNAVAAAEELKIPVELIRVAAPGNSGPAPARLPPGESAVLFRGRAAVELAPFMARHSSKQFVSCPHENLRAPERVHIDPLGFVHICQGISLGNVFEQPLGELFRQFEPDAHPVVGPLLKGGPVGLAQHYGITPGPGYADACHLCYMTRCALRSRLPGVLVPDQMYGSR
jgi:MoaA/NifB/PqqE/SkfB family radical SAM enzyme